MAPTTPVAGYRNMYSRDPVTGLLYGIGVAPPPSPFQAQDVEPVPAGQDFVWGDTSQVSPVGSNPLAMDHLVDVDTTSVAPVVGDLLRFDGTNWVPGASSASPSVTFTSRVGWYRIATFRGVGSAEITLIQTGRSKSAIRVLTLSWTGERMQIDVRGLTGYGNYLPNYSLSTTGVYGEQYLDVETVSDGAMGAVHASFVVMELNADGPGSVFQPPEFTLEATEIAAPAGTATAWPAV